MNDGVYLSMKYEDDSPFVKGRKHMPISSSQDRIKKEKLLLQKEKDKKIKCLTEMVSYWKHRYQRMKKKGY